MLAPHLPPLSSSTALSEASRYFDHRAATCGAVEMLVGAELNVLWSNAAALALMSRRRPVGLGDNRLVLSPRRQEDSLRAFLASLGAGTGVWVLQGEDAWLVRAEAIAPPDAPLAWLLTWQPMDHADRYRWADLGAHLRLTPSEIRILRKLLEGSTVDQAAGQLTVSVQTVRTHVRRIYAKLGVKSREQLFAVALPYRWG